MKSNFEKGVEREALHLTRALGPASAIGFATSKVIEIESDESPRANPNETLAFWCEVRDLLVDWRADEVRTRAEAR